MEHPQAGNTNATTQGTDGSAAAAAAGNLLDPLSTQLTPDQLAAMLSTGAYSGLGTLGGAGLQGSDNSAAALNALLLGGGLNLNQLAASNLQLAGLGADLSALGAVLGGDMGEHEDYGAGGGKGGGLNVTSNKQLSSRFRGVCWNKKNKRWQAAINSSGKYLYLGSFTNEDEAARQFDRAAIKLRGKKAKLNFEYADYVDENGELLDEIILPQGALSGKDEAARGSSGGARRGSKAAGMDSNCVDMSGLTPDFVNQAAFAAIMQQGAWQGMSRSGKTAVVAAPLALEREQVSVLLPPGCGLEYLVPVQDTGAGGGSSSGSGTSNKTLFGVVYKDSGSGMYGAGVWTGYMFKAFGQYPTEDSAAQTARSAGELLSEDRDLRVSGGVANQQSMGLMAAPAGLLTGAGGAAGAFPQDALALAGLAAGLGSSSGRGAAANGAGAGVGAAGLLGVAPGLMGAGMGGLANVSLAQAAQLAQQAAAEQGLPMSYPPLSVALPVVTSGLQLLPGGGVAGAMGDAATAAALDAAKASNEAEMQQLMQQLMQQQQSGAEQLGAAAAGMQGADGFLKLANLDMTQLRQQLMEQQQQQGLAGAGATEQQHQQQVLGSIPDLDVTAKRPLEAPGGAAAVQASAEAAAAAAAVAAAEAAAAVAASMAMAAGNSSDGPAAKRMKTDSAAAAGGVGPGGEMAQLDLQDALKMLRSVQQAGQE